MSPNKIDALLEAHPETAEGVSESLGMDIREVMTTVSRVSPASTYHNSYGLVLEGDIVGCFDNDTGKILQDDGTYNEHGFDFTHVSSPEELLQKWYEDFSTKNQFTWNEVILAKGSRVVGAFYDPSYNPGKLLTIAGRTQIEEYRLFRDKIQRCGLRVLEISSKFGVN